MPTFFGLSAMPTTFLNAALGAFRDRSVPVRGPDRLAVISPMYNEEAGAERALASLLSQTVLPHELVVSINSSTDRTYDVVTATLVRFGFLRTELGSAPGFPAGLERWRHPDRPVKVMVLLYRHRTAKSEAINNLAVSHLLESERVLIVDGDTVFEKDFIHALRDNFYRLRWERGRAVVEDYALQSGSVTSFVPPRATALQRFISAGRAAEYAFSGVLRRGQVHTFGNHVVWGSSRLYTVVGCGFAARRDVLPMPPDTLTEDHDLTLTAQMCSRTVRRTTPAELDRRGFRIVEDGNEIPFAAAFDVHDAVELRRGGNARFVGEALMHTEDPAHLGGYLRQIERWNAGGIQNALKRLWGDAAERRLTANVRFALLAAQLENLLGLLLLLVVPVLMALGLAGTLPVRSLIRNLALWVGIDLVATGAMTFAGFYLQVRSARVRSAVALRRAAGRTVRSWIPYMVLKVANPVSFVAAATRVVPDFVLERRVRRLTYTRTRGVAWERPTVQTVDRRTVGTAATMALTLGTVFSSVLLLAPSSSADQVATQRMLRRTVHVDIAHHDGLPLDFAPGATLAVARTNPGVTPAGAIVHTSARIVLAPLGPVAASTAVAPGAQLPTVGLKPPRATIHLAVDRGAAAGQALSAYCRPSYVLHPASTVHRLPGQAADYRPLDSWQLLVLGRLAPIEPYIEQAATAYDVPAGFLTQVLINESYLDPLAVGITGDKGLSQMTSDALTLLRAVSDRSSSALYNPHLLHGAFNVFDPDFSICAGAAKLAWATARPSAKDRAQAYALYINPLVGVSKSGRIASDLDAPVEAMEQLEPLVRSLGRVYAAFRADPTKVSEPERELMKVSADVASHRIDLAEAYRRSSAIVASLGVQDEDVYRAVLAKLYPTSRAYLEQGERASSR